MSDFNKRLVAADPASGQSYAHHDPEAMVSRIVTQYPVRRRHVLRDFQLRMAGAVTLATVLTVGGIAALDAAVPGLPVLALASAHTTTSPSTPGTQSPTIFSGSNTMMRIYREYHFTAGAGLSASASTGNAYRLQLTSDPSVEVSGIASIFSVSGSPVDVSGDGTSWTVTDPSGPSVSYDNYGGVPTWNYQSTSPSAVATPPLTGTSGIEASPAQATPSQATIEAHATRYLGQLDYGYQVTAPQFSTSSGTTTGPDQVTTATNWETVNYSVLVDGTLTDQSVQFTFDSNNQLVSASGPAFGVNAPVSYPLQSEVAGVAVLNAQQLSYFAQNGQSGAPSGNGGTVAPSDSGSGPVAPDTTNPSSGSAGSSTGTVPSPGTTDTSVTTTTTGPPIVEVTLDSVGVSLQAYTLTDGSVWLLPIYIYGGVVTPSGDNSYNGSWSTIAVDPAYVQPAAVTGPILY